MTFVILEDSRLWEPSKGLLDQRQIHSQRLCSMPFDPIVIFRTSAQTRHLDSDRIVSALDAVTVLILAPYARSRHKKGQRQKVSRILTKPRPCASCLEARLQSLQLLSAMPREDGNKQTFAHLSCFCLCHASSRRRPSRICPFFGLEAAST